MKKYEFIVEKTGTGYSAYDEAQGAYTTGATMEDLQVNMVTALSLALSTADKTVPVTMADIKATYDLESFFEQYRIINVSQLAKRLGMTQSMLSQYTSGAKKAGEKQTRRILEGIRAVGRELAEIDFA